MESTWLPTRTVRCSPSATPALGTLAPIRRNAAGSGHAARHPPPIACDSGIFFSVLIPRRRVAASRLDISPDWACDALEGAVAGRQQHPQRLEQKADSVCALGGGIT